MSLKKPFKVIAMHDMCGYGRSSLTAAFPVLSVLNIQVCPLPTALLSSHFGFPTQPTFLNLGQELEKFIPSWQKAGFTFDAFYSGYLADPSQVQIAVKYIKEFNPQWVYVDPVLGDGAKLYPGFDDQQVQAMRELVKYAHAISPNVTEACFLLGETPKEFLSTQEAKDMLVRLSAMGPKFVSITGIKSEDEKTIAVFSLDNTKNQFYKISMPSFPGWFHGTGDSFASAVLGNLMAGISFVDSTNRAMTYLYESLKMAVEHNIEICLEPTLPILMAGTQNAQVQEIK